MEKKYYENKIYELTKAILDDKILIDIKKQRREEIKKQLKSNIKDKTRKNLKRELEYIDTDENIEELVQFNHSKNFLMEVEPNEKIVLAMGINPGGGSEIIKHSEVTNDSIYFIKDDNNELEDKEILNIFNGCYVFTHGYHRANYDIFEKIHAKAHWAKKGYLSDDEIYKMVKNSAKYNDKDFNNLDITKITQTIGKMQEIEMNKRSGPYVMFGDLIWYSDGTQANLEKSLKMEKNYFNENIKRIIELNIEYYNPKLIVVTNAFASNLIRKALDNETINKNRQYEDVLDCKNVPIILSGMVSGRRSMDIYSRERLKDRIKEIYEKVEKGEWKK